ncbi:AAA-domain-containing protein [Neoconidiobolus thromboides FSU 785]|nr:AAA-domain-containing protein [Neoconidiobolus thromboides FSU 785]
MEVEIKLWIEKVANSIQYLDQPTKIELKQMIIDVLVNNYNQGIIIFGPNGIGKSTLLKQLVAYCPFKATFLEAKNCWDMNINNDFGNNLNKLLEKEKEDFNLLAIDDIHYLKEYEKSIIKFYLKKPKENNKLLLLVSGELNKIDKELMISGRLNFELKLNQLNLRQRELLLLELLKPWLDNNAIELSNNIAQLTSNFTPADLKNMVHRVMLEEMDKNNVFVYDNNNNNNNNNNNEEVIIELKQSFENFLNNYLPFNFKNELSYLTVQKNNDNKWEDIQGMEKIQEELNEILIEPLKLMMNSESNQIENKIPKGILFYGLSGTGKSMLCQCLANKLNISYLNLDGTQIRSKIVGETEKNIVNLFQQAKNNAPTLLCIEQIEMLLPKRMNDVDTTENSQHRILTTFLTEMDGVYSISQSLKDLIIIIGLTNNLKNIDNAILRQGRIGHHIYFNLPDFNQRYQILMNEIQKIQVVNKLNKDEIQLLAKNSENCSNAELIGICREAVLMALRENINCEEILFKHYENSLTLLNQTKQSIS